MTAMQQDIKDFIRQGLHVGVPFDQPNERLRPTWVTIRTNLTAFTSACAHAGIHPTRVLLCASMTGEKDDPAESDKDERVKCYTALNDISTHKREI